MEHIDQNLFEWIFGAVHRSDVLDALGVFFALYFPYILIAAFIILVFGKNDWRMRIFVFGHAVLTVIISRGIITEGIRFFYSRPRPPEILDIDPLILKSGHAFPSGHMAFYFALAMVVWYTNRRWGHWYFGLVALMGVARVFVGVHWPLDIVGGMAIAAGSAILIYEIIKKYRPALLED